MIRRILAFAVLATTLTGTAIAGPVVESIPSASGYEQIRDGRLDLAEKVLINQMRVHPDAPELDLNLAAIYLRTGRTTEAVPLYERVLANPAVAMDMPSGAVVSSHDVARRATDMIASGSPSR